MIRNNFSLHKLICESEELLNKSRIVLSKIKDNEIDSLMHELPRQMIPDNERLRIVFVGQYSAGKSSIIKALTGLDEIKVGAGITTQKQQSYDWNGIEIYDTPGIQTGIRPDHDEITYKMIAEANLIVFVVTNELFDSQLSENFKKLAIDSDKGHEMMLVVNKMDRHSCGNSLDAHKIISNDLERVLEPPFTPENLYITFLDLDSYNKSLVADDEEERDYFYKKSGYDSFIDNLNKFVSEKKLVSEYTKYLYELQHVLEEAIKLIPTEDKDVEAIILNYQKKKNALTDFKRNIKNKSKNVIAKTELEIKEIGRNLANELSSATDPQIYNEQLKEVSERINNRINALSEDLQNILYQENNDYNLQIDEIMNLEITKVLSDSIASRFPNLSTNTLHNMGKLGKCAKNLGEYLIKNSYNSSETGCLAKWLMRDYSKTPMHNAVKEIGSFFGHKFKPWEATKITKSISNAGKCLAIIGTALSFVAVWYEDCEEEKQLQEIRNTKQSIRNYFNEVGNEVELHYDSQIDTFVANSLTPNIDGVNEQISELMKTQNTNSDLQKALLDLNDECLKLIKKFH